MKPDPPVTMIFFIYYLKNYMINVKLVKEILNKIKYYYQIDSNIHSSNSYIKK